VFRAIREKLQKRKKPAAERLAEHPRVDARDERDSPMFGRNPSFRGSPGTLKDE
jgi:hypothetical protein